MFQLFDALGSERRCRAVEPQSVSCPRTIMSRSLKRAVIAWAPSGMTSVASSSTAVIDGAPSLCAGNTSVVELFAVAAGPVYLGTTASLLSIL